MEKFKIQVIDFLLQREKFTSGLFDIDGNELFLGDTVDRDGMKYLIAYRYGKYVLKPPLTGLYIEMTEKTGVKKRMHTVTAVPDEWLIIGYTSEPLYQILVSKNVI